MGASALWLRRARLPRWTLGVDTIAEPVEHDLRLEGGRITAVRVHGRDAQPAEPSTQVIDLQGAVLMPALVEPHAHLDKAYTVHRAPPTGPGLLAAIEATSADSARWTADDLRSRARRGLIEARASGALLLRTHLNWWSPETPLAWSVLGELAQEADLSVELERVNISPLELFSDAGVAACIAGVVAASTGGVLGVFVHTHNHRTPADDAALMNVFRQAAEHGLRIDLHADEELNPAARGVAMAATLTLEYGLQGRVACSHACALAAQDQALALHTLDAVAAARVTLISLPSTNLLLQDASVGRTPRLRGLTLVQEARARGIAVLLGSDNVQDAFSPQGRHDPIGALSLGCLVGHLDDPLDDASRMVCDRAALGRDDGWRGWLGAPADLLIALPASGAERDSGAVNRGLAFPSDVGARIVLHSGRVVAGEPHWRALSERSAAPVAP